MSQRLLGVVLCGGQSTRMKRDKALLQHPEGGTFLDHAIGRLRRVCDRVVISAAASSSDYFASTHTRVILDPVSQLGPVVGIATALAEANAEGFSGCLFTPVDTPWLKTTELELLRDRWLESASLTIARSDRLEPLMGVYPVSLADELMRLTESADRSLFRWLQTQPQLTIVDLPLSSCHNINTPEDLAQDGC